MAEHSGELTPYDELAALLEDLPRALQQARRMRRLSFRAAGAAIGIDQSTTYRVERGDGCTIETAICILRWLGADHG